MSRSLVALLIGAVWGLISCKSKPAEMPLPQASGARVFVVCEGAYGNGNSALTVYYPDSGIVVADAFAQANGRSLGDVFQSMTSLPGSDQFLLCINNSDRLLVLEKSSLQERAELLVPKPRYAVPASSSKVYVSSLFGPYVYVVNPQSQSISTRITMPYKNPEGLLLAQGKLWVAPWDTAATHIYALDTASNEVVDSMQLSGRGPQEILEDAQGMFWVLSGNDAQGVTSKLTRLNPNTGMVIRSYDFSPAVAIKPTMNAARDTLYFLEIDYQGGSLHNGVYRMNIQDARLPQQAFIPAQGLQYFWGLGVHPRNGTIYVADPKGFTQKGRVKVYQPDGHILDSFSTGVGPGHFYFEP
ncbi:MAG: hypothetical protein JST06_03050 [Bacteroidetes bacterium]|nr:hypothetical protein [Bacteroidota bacterium]